MRKSKRAASSRPRPEARVHSSSASSSEQGNNSQEHARARGRSPLEASLLSPPALSTSDMSTSISNISLSSSISRFRNDFDELKCKMLIFGESLNLCRCIADDFTGRLNTMEKRLTTLERRQVIWRSESNYSAIIQKNKRLSQKTQQEAKKLQMCGTEEEMREVAGRICRNYLHGAWKTVPPQQLHFRRISGGLSNFLYYVALPEEASSPPGVAGVVGVGGRDSSPEAECDTLASRLARRTALRSNSFSSMEEPTKVLLRIYGQVHGERAMDAIVTESVIFTLLSERRLGPKLHGVFSGGRIEQYIPARPLLTRELSEPALSMKIAEKMAAIHSMDVPLAKEPRWLWTTMHQWTRVVLDQRLPHAQGQNDEEARIIKQLKGVDFEKEVEWLKKYLATIESPVVFCHNDMQEGNILLLEEGGAAVGDEYPPAYPAAYPPTDAHDDADTSDSIISRVSDMDEPKLVLIDFEYCAYNHRGFDLANHFQEWAFDYTHPAHPFYTHHPEHTPSIEQKEIFIRSYLQHCPPGGVPGGAAGGAEQTLEEVNRLLCEVEGFALASHLFWSLWSFVNASKSQIPFGYWEYGVCRLEIYQRLKMEVMKKDSSHKRKICEVDI